MEKSLRIYDLNRPDAAPREVDKSPGSVRTVAWLHSDQTILSSCTDMGGVRYCSHIIEATFVCILFVEVTVACQSFTQVFSECTTDCGT